MTYQWTGLSPGEPIGVVALSGPVAPERLEPGLAELARWGHELVLAPNLRSAEGYLAGTDGARLDGLRWVLDRGARVVVGARGGYGVTRLLRLMPWPELVARRVCLVGYSDLTALLNPLASAGGAVQVHGPMVAAGLDRHCNARRLRRLLLGELIGEPLFTFNGDAVVHHGRAQGRLIGGNLSLLVSLLGTPWEVDLDGAVLLLEEIREPLYRLDRMLTQLAASATFPGVKALIGGSLRSCGPAGERDRRWRELLSGLVASQVPVVVGLPYGHSAVNMAFPIGATVDVDTVAGTLTWSA